MMTLDEFSNEVAMRLPGLLPEKYQNVSVELGEKHSVNEDTKSISVRLPDETVAPNINLGAFYERYSTGKESLDEVMSRLSESVMDAFERISKDFHNFDATEKLTEDKVYMELINTKSNDTLLSTCPSRGFNDMSVIYRVLINKSPDGIESIIVTNELAEQMGLSEDELFEHASKNTKELFPPKVEPLYKMLLGMMGEDVPPGLAEEMAMDAPPLYIITNDVGVQGATMMVYDDILQDVSRMTGGDIYILPSSIHEVLVVPQEDMDLSYMSTMVSDINQEHVSEKDRLSNQVFAYDAETRTLTQATDFPVLGIRDEDFAMKPQSFVAEPPVRNSYAAAVR